MEQRKPPDAASSEPPTLQLVREAFPEGVVETCTPFGDATAVVRPESLRKILAYLRDEPRLRFNVLVDLTAVDYLGRTPRFEVVYQLLSIPANVRMCVKVRVDGPDPTVDSVADLWGIANWYEREVWDMFGVRFAGHPDLKRILLYEEFEGHPLRKDYPIRKRQPLIGPKN
jgi:NADH-quinone oxidoreductase subunit C